MVLSDAREPWDDESLEAMSRLESFVKDTYGSTAPNLHRVFSPETRLKLKPSLTAGWGPLKGTISAEQIEVTHLPTIIYEVNDALAETVIRCLRPDFSYHVCFDELDRGFSTSDDNYRHRISGLLIAARDFNRRLRRAEKSASVVIFLRDDILRYLKFEDKNKIVEDFSSVIEWDKPGSSQSLKNVMARRFAKILNLEVEKAWDEVFNEGQQMPSRQSKFQHIIDRTFKRPRDIIKFSNEILKSYKQKGPVSSKFENNDIRDARAEYSKYLRKELTDEMHQHFDQEEAAFDLLRTIGSVSFTLKAFAEAHRNVANRREGLIGYSEMIRELYNFSAVAFLKVGGSGGGSEWVWRYEDTDAEYDERATIFRVHSGLKEVLGLKQGRAVGEGEVVEIEPELPLEDEM